MTTKTVKTKTENMIDFLKNLFMPKKHLPEEYVDLGNGPDWFAEFTKTMPTLSDFFGLKDDRKKEIKATIGKTGYYQFNGEKRYCVIAHYFDAEQKKEFTFYCPGFDYDPINDHAEGDTLKMFVDKDDYSKYEMPIY